MPRVSIELPDGGVTITAPAPTYVSQATSEHVLGLPRRAFLRAAAEFRAAGGPVTKWGRLRLVPHDPFVAWLRDRQDGAAADDGVERMAGELGLKIVGGS